MPTRPAGVARSPHIAGRHEEQRLLAAALDDAANGSPCAFLIHGEAGVGKTRLVQQVCDQARDRGFAVLWGRCVRFGAIEAPYYPLLRALNVWAQDADDADRARILGDATDVEEFSTQLTDRIPSGASGLFAAIDALIAAMADQSPTVLVVDDLQWADLASRDALSYLIAGFHRQRLAVLATYRDEAWIAGDPLHGWLADARRLPGVVDLGLARLNAHETEEQLQFLLGSAPHPSLVADVMDRSNGNPYLSELLVRDLAPDAEKLPSEVPAVLSEALLAAWHQLPRSSRTVLGILSVAGRPATSTELTEVVRSRGVDPVTCPVALREAEDHGIVVEQGNDLFWFRHPLLAEVLYGTFSLSELGPIHAAWARELETHAGGGIDEVRRWGDLARHYEAGGDLPKSLEASLYAAALAEEFNAVREVALHLQQGVRLWPKVHDDEEGRRLEGELLERAARASRRVGDGDTSLRAWRRALALVDESIDPLRASKLLVELADTTWELGLTDGEPIVDLTQAVRLSQAWPDSSEYAQALASLSANEAWLPAMSDRAVAHADEAVAAARRSSSPRALSLAHMARAYARKFGDDMADQDTRTALESALESQDREQVCWAYVARGNFIEVRGHLSDVASHMIEGFEFARKANELSMTAFMSGALAKVLLVMGRLQEAGAVVREGLSRSASSNSAANVRLGATLVAIRGGQLPAASLHLERAKELIPELEERPGLEAPPMLAEYALARGRPAETLDLLTRTLDAHGVDPRLADSMLMWGARAAADLAERGRDLGEANGLLAARTALRDLIERRNRHPVAPFAVVTFDDPVQPAVKALFEAELRRCDGVAGTSSAWEQAVRCCELAEMRWEAEVSRLRRAQALAIEGASKSVVSTEVRTGHAFAVDAGALPLQQEFQSLAQACGVSLDVAPAPTPAAKESRFESLTPREHEVLTNLVAGRTYREIAAELFISEKTVSAHVSNVLRKTGTSSRREVAILAQRLSVNAAQADALRGI